MTPTSSAWHDAIALGIPAAFAISIYEPRLAAAEIALQRIRDLHRLMPGDDSGSECTGCDFPYPCPTIRALDPNGTDNP